MVTRIVIGIDEKERGAKEQGLSLRKRASDIRFLPLWGSRESGRPMVGPSGG